MRKQDGLKGGYVLSGHTPDDDDDAVEDVVGVPQVLEEAKGGELQDHLQREHTGENNVADLQDVGQLIGLGSGGQEAKKTKQNRKNLLRLKSRLKETK